MNKKYVLMGVMVLVSSMCCAMEPMHPDYAKICRLAQYRRDGVGEVKARRQLNRYAECHLGLNIWARSHLIASDTGVSKADALKSCRVLRHMQDKMPQSLWGSAFKLVGGSNRLRECADSGHVESILRIAQFYIQDFRATGVLSSFEYAQWYLEMIDPRGLRYGRGRYAFAVIHINQLSHHRCRTDINRHTINPLGYVTRLYFDVSFDSVLQYFLLEKS